MMDVTRAEVAALMRDAYSSGRIGQADWDAFRDRGLIKKCSLPDGAWYIDGPGRFTDDADLGQPWHCQVLAVVSGPDGGVRIRPWLNLPTGVRAFSDQESNPFDVVQVIDKPWWVTP